jgi:hypothetical protein
MGLKQFHRRGSHTGPMTRHPMRFTLIDITQPSYLDPQLDVLDTPRDKVLDPLGRVNARVEAHVSLLVGGEGRHLTRRLLGRVRHPARPGTHETPFPLRGSYDLSTSRFARAHIVSGNHGACEPHVLTRGSSPALPASASA